MIGIFKKLFGIYKLEAEIARLNDVNNKLISENEKLSEKLEVALYAHHHAKTYWYSLWNWECDAVHAFAKEHLTREQWNKFVQSTCNQEAVEIWAKELREKYGDDLERLNKLYKEAEEWL